jgi:hypothetical protein
MGCHCPLVKDGRVPRLSILIPCLGGAAEFDGTLVAVLQHRPADCQVLVIHREAYDDPYGLAGDVEFVEAAEAKSLCELLNLGLAAAAGEFIHVLACGLTPRDGWTEPALARLGDEEVAAVVPVITQDERLAAAGVRFTLGGSRTLLSDERLLQPGSGHLRAAIGGPTLAAGFYRRDVLLALEGFDEGATDQLADASLALDLAALDLRAELEPASRIEQVDDLWTAASDWSFARGRAAERLFWRQAAQGNLPLALAAHAVAVAIDSLAHLPQITGLVLGRIIALCELGSVRKSQVRLAAAAEELRQLAAAKRPVQKATSVIRRAA